MLFSKIREGERAVIIFPGIGQSESYYRALFRNTSCALFYLNYTCLSQENFSTEAEALDILKRELVTVSSSYGGTPLWLAYSFGGRIALKLWARQPTAACRPGQLMLVAADGLCVHPLYQLATKPSLRSYIARLVRMRWFTMVLLWVLPFWGFRRRALKKFFAHWPPEQIYALWCFWANQLPLPDCWPTTVHWVAAEKDRLFPVRCFKRLVRFYPGKIRLRVLERTSHFMAPSTLEPIIQSWLSGKHHQDENKNI